jgi:hypothetical protein
MATAYSGTTMPSQKIAGGVGIPPAEAEANHDRTPTPSENL